MNNKGLKIFIVAGRTGHSLVLSKAMPFAALHEIEKIYIFCQTKGFPLQKCEYITLPTILLKTKPAIFGKFLRFLYEPFQLFFYVLKLRPDLINGIYCLPKGLNSFIVSKLTGTKCFNSIIGSILEVKTELPLKKMWEKINLWQLRGCNAVLVKGEKEKNYLIDNDIDPKKIFYFNGAIDIEKFTPGGNSREIDIIYVGSFIEIKGTDRIVKTIRKIVFDFPGLKMLMVGNGKLQNDAINLCQKLDLSRNIEFTGYQKDTAQYYKKSKILFMASRSESLPTSMLEAMSCGCVPVVPDVGNITQAAKHRFNAIVEKDYNNLDGFADAIILLLRNDELRCSLSVNARHTVEENYSLRNQSLSAFQIINFLTDQVNGK